MSDKVFDLLAGGFTQGRDAAKIHGVGLHQIRVKLMVADDLAKPIADLRPTVVSIGRLRRNLAHLPIGFRLGTEPISSTEQMPIPYALRSARLTALVSATRISAPFMSGETLEGSASPSPTKPRQFMALYTV